MQHLKRIFMYLGMSLGILFVILVINTLLSSPKPLNTEKSRIANQRNLNEKLNKSALEHLAAAITYRVIGYDDANNDSINHRALLQFHAWMKATYPLVAQQARWEVINQHSLLITLKGKNQTPAAMFLGHLDVVPVPDSNQWKQAPFGGNIQKDTLYGRGSLDDKNVVIALLEAAEHTLSMGMSFNRTLIFAFGHDEETGGINGAAAIAKHLLQQKIPISFIADEGFGVMNGIVPGLKNPCAIIGLSEKGSLSVKLSVKQVGGHSAWPSPENATSILTKGLGKLELFQFPSQLKNPIRGLFSEAAPYMTFGYRLLFSNLWITAPLVKSVLEQGEKTAATIRTTHVTTILRAGTKENVVPPQAEAIVNLRLFPGDTISGVLAQIKHVLNDPRIGIEIYLNAKEASPISPSNGDGYDQIKAAVHAQFPETVVVPGLVITGTDCKNYTAITQRMYRFVPFEFNSTNLSGIHGINEFITRRQFNQAVIFYVDLFQRL